MKIDAYIKQLEAEVQRPLHADDAHTVRLLLTLTVDIDRTDSPGIIRKLGEWWNQQAPMSVHIEATEDED